MREEVIKKIEEEGEKDFSYAINETGDYRDTWRIFRIMAEFVEGYQFLNSFTKEVTVLGSARFDEGHNYYTVAKELGGLLAKSGYTTITGGGPGIMEASNRGAKDAGGESVGLNIQLPFEQRINPYVTKSTAFYYFFTRKVMLTSPADAFVYFPGGFGTMDEFFEVIDHMEIGKLCHSPVVLVGKTYWEPLLDFLRDKICSFSPIHLAAIDSWHVVDTAKEAFDIIEQKGAQDKACELSPLNFHGAANTMHWRVFRIMAELVEGFEFLTGVVEDVTILGTKSVTFDSPYYKSAYLVGRELANDGYSVVTGGAEGIAEAANKGAMEAGGQSFGVGMELHGKSRMNQYVTKSIMFKFPFTRKLIVTAPSKAFVFFPGGFGTMHQLFEILTLIQTKKMQKIPVILFDTAFWGQLDTYIKEVLVKRMKTISPEDTDLYTVVDSEEEILRLVNEFRGKKGKNSKKK